MVVCGCICIPVLIYYSSDLPDHTQLAEYKSPIVTRVYDRRGVLMSEFAEENRIYVRVDEVPQLVIDAFIAAEDKNYYSHPGLDITSIARAMLYNVLNINQGKHLTGASTITQQVIKNFLLTNERTLSRKIKEAILAYRVTKLYSKEQILELYLNQIFLGNRAYGIAAASLYYFNKRLDELTVAEAAMLGALPKAPSKLDPTRSPERALVRRNWVIERMLEEEFISKEEAEAARDTGIDLVKYQDKRSTVKDCDYYTSAIRAELVEKYGEHKLYNEGLIVYSNMDSKLQATAQRALRRALMEYDKRHGWRGPIQRLKKKDGSFMSQLKAIERPKAALDSWHLAVVTEFTSDGTKILLQGGKTGEIPFRTMRWARRTLGKQYIGPVLNAASDTFRVGDLILVSKAVGGNRYFLQQIPNANGAMLVTDSSTGQILALSGGWSFKDSNFNRATQAKRQPGSVFKTFVYLAALENGYYPTSIVMDEPIEMEQGPGLPTWTPKNYGGKFMGPITLRTALEKSKNVATVKLLTALGIEKVVELTSKLRVYKDPQSNYSMALGANETTPLGIAWGYNTIASGGKAVRLSLISAIQDRGGETMFAPDYLSCIGCENELSEYTMLDDDAHERRVAQVYNSAPQIIDPIANYQLTSILNGSVKRGTSRRLSDLDLHLASKTGTTNDSKDAWCVAFTPDLVVVAYIGFDSPRTLGDYETGATVALPAAKYFMQYNMGIIPKRDFDVPEGIEFIEIDSSTGTFPTDYSLLQDIVLEPFHSAEIPRKEEGDGVIRIDDDTDTMTWVY